MRNVTELLSSVEGHGWSAVREAWCKRVDYCDEVGRMAEEGAREAYRRDDTAHELHNRFMALYRASSADSCVVIEVYTSLDDDPTGVKLRARLERREFTWTM